MTLDELMEQADELTYQHGQAVADQVPYDASVSKPHDGKRSDLSEHHHLVCATAEVDDQLNARLAAAIAAYRQDNSIT